MTTRTVRPRPLWDLAAWALFVLATLALILACLMAVTVAA